MLSAFFILISRHNSGEEITIGLPTINRWHPQLLKMLGLCLNTSLIVQKIDEEMSFLDLMQLTEQNWNQIKKYESFPYGEIVRELRPRHTVNRNPYFDILFNYLPKKFRHPWHLSGLKQICEDFNSSETELFLSWYIFESNEDDGFTLGCKSILELLDYKSINILFWQYHSLLEQVIKHPEKKLSSYSLLFPENIDVYHRALSKDPTQLADYSNYYFYSDQVKLPNPAELIIETDYPLAHHMIQDHVKNQPTHPAIVLGDESWSYADLGSTAETIANTLMTHGVVKGDVIAIHGEMSVGLCSSVIGAWLAGGVILLIDRSHPAEYKRTLALESKAKWLITLFPQDAKDNEMFQVFPESSIIYVDPKTVRNIAGEHHALPDLTSSDPAYIFFTSGTTGVPKGIKGTHRGLSHFLNWQRTQFNIDSTDRCGQITNLSFDVIMREVFTPLISGASLYIPPPANSIETGTYLDWLETNQITLQHIVPTLADFLLQKASSHITLKNLRWLFFAGEPLQQRLVKQWRNRFPESGNLVNLYGPTETTLAKTFYIIPPQPLEGVQPIGNPLPQTQVIILNKEKQMCGVGEAGEICIRTPYRTMGYINPSEKDKNRFFPNPFRNDPNDLFYMSGDLGFTLYDGTICISGRADDQIKINGIRIDPSGIANIIAEDPNVNQCVVIGKKSEDGKAKLIAYVVAKEGFSQEKTKEIILGNMRGKFPNYMIPYAIVLLDKIPMTARGKLDKKALPEPEVTEKISSEVKIRKPNTQVEKDLAAYWEKELGVKSANLDDDFFESGGDSLDGVKMIIHIREFYGIDLKLHDLISHPTLQGLADHIENGTRESINIRMSLQELSKYLVLPNISIEKASKYDDSGKVSAIFITGAAGFLGSYLLNDLIDAYPQAKFHCLVRAKNATHGLERIHEAFIQNKLKNAAVLKECVVPIIGDLSKPYFGLSAEQFQSLSSEIDLIYHSGALVNFVYNFSQLKPSNIDGTSTVIELSTNIKIKSIHYVSTAGIYPSSLTSEQNIISDNEEIGTTNDVLVGGYVQTKWVADHLMQKARSLGVPVTIYRPGRISWDTETNIWQENDAIFRFIYGCIQLGHIPDLPISVDLNPVNMVAKAITYISTRKEFANANYNIVNPSQITVSELANHLNTMGVKMDVISYAQWRSKLYAAFKEKKDNVLFPLIDLFAESLEEMPRLRYRRHFDCQNLLSALKESTIHFPKMDYPFFYAFMSEFFKSIQKIVT